MKTNYLTPRLWLGFAALTASGWAQDAAPASAETATRASNPPSPANVATPAAARPTNGLKFNFRGAPLETVLNYMSDAAGYVIITDTPVRGTVDMYSAQPVSREEAVQLLNIALNKNGYTATVQGRSLVVSSKDDAKKRNLPIRTGNDPEEIPNNAEMVMQIIPLRNIDATNAARDLGTMLPGTSTITANADSNSLLVTDTNMNLKHVVELVNALDTSMSTNSTMKIFKLKNADPYEMASLLMNLYASPTTNANSTSGRGTNPFSSRGGFSNAAAAFGAAALAARGGFAGGGFGAPGGPGGFGGSSRSSRSGTGGGGGRLVPVVAVADPRTYSVIVTASKDQMPDITEMVNQLDASTARKQKVFVYTMENADVKQVENTLRNLFQSNNVRQSNNNQPDALTTRATINAQNNASSNLQLGTNGSTRTN